MNFNVSNDLILRHRQGCHLPKTKNKLAAVNDVVATNLKLLNPIFGDDRFFGGQHFNMLILHNISSCVGRGLFFFGSSHVNKFLKQRRFLKQH